LNGNVLPKDECFDLNNLEDQAARISAHAEKSAEVKRRDSSVLWNGA